MLTKRKVKIIIDGNVIETYEGTTILEAALNARIYIPHLCYHPLLSTTGECELCLIKIKGIKGLQKACTIEAEEGMSILTNDEEISSARKKNLTELLKGHPHECIGCPKYLNCELQSLKQFIGVNQGNLLIYPVKPLSVIDENPLILFEPTKCVLCKRCIRACRDLRGIGILEVKEVNGCKYVYTQSGKPLKEEGCLFCGTCIEVCPTAAIREKRESVSHIKNKVPCKESCPIGIDIPEFLRLMKERDYYKAINLLKDKSPFSKVLSYICHRPCEKNCRRAYLNDPIAIKELKLCAFEIVDRMQENMRKENPKEIKSVRYGKKKVAIIGGGPSGLSAAYFLSKMGIEVTIFEKEASLGGMMRMAIPNFRLPREVLDYEIETIIRLGVDVKLNHQVLELDNLKEQGFSAILVAIGANKPIWPQNVPKGLTAIYTAVDFLKKFNSGERLQIGEKVVVIGGGLSAVDCALAAKRLGAREVSLFCLEDKTELAWGTEEIEALESEKIIVNTRMHLKEIILRNGKWEGIFQEIGGFLLDDGEIRIQDPKQRMVQVLCDIIIFAIGQCPEVPQSFGLTTKKNGTLEIDQYTFLTSREGVFACGDVAYGMKSVSDACAHGRRAAYAISRHLGIERPVKDIKVVPNFSFTKIPGFGDLGRRKITDNACEEEAIKEAMRCLQCDNRLYIPNVTFWCEY